MTEKKINAKEAVQVNFDFVKKFLNISESGIKEFVKFVKNSKGKVRVIMHPNNLHSADGAKENRVNNEKYKKEFMPWFAELIYKQQSSLANEEDSIVPLIIMIEEDDFISFKEYFEKFFGNHLTKFGVLIIPTKNNQGKQTTDQSQITKDTAVEFGVPADTEVERFSYSGNPYLFDLLRIKEIILSGGFIGEMHPEDSNIYGRCLGLFMTSFLRENLKRPRNQIKISVDPASTLLKDGVRIEDLELSGINIL